MINNRYQQGAAFIVVMFVLLLVTIIGALAIKQSLTGLNIATNSQIQALLQQNSDAAFFAIERDNRDSTLLQKNLSSLGMLGLVKSDQFLNKEVVFCYRPKTASTMFSLSRTSIIYWEEKEEGGKKEIVIKNRELGSEGFCKHSSNFFTSSRDTVITQIAVKKASLDTDVPFKFFPLGTDTTTVQLDQVQPVRIIITSVLPGAATKSWTKDKVNECFENNMNEKIPGYSDENTVAKCLGDLGMPYSQQVMDYAVISYAKQGS
ncbi:pilus assembly protein [Acinetobacter sp. YH12102]|uniref:pilus assembly PilX family protein n=1 Tax=Acinetobacter sp. YH12102 TaxID=2601091 RepID=UPI0015D17222|nr:pilus assembly protein [Acinetobacter sp. YH12102]